MSDPALLGFGLLWYALAGYLAWLYRYGPRHPLFRQILRQIYTNAALPLAVRGGMGALPAWILVIGLSSTIAFVGPTVGRWMAALLVMAFGLACLLSYQAPPPFLPQFLRDEIAQGVIELQRPTLFDWLLLTFVLGLFVVGGMLLLLVNLGFG